MQATSEMSYSTVGMGLRAPRVVVVIDGDEHWTYWVRRALYLAGQVWGGAGFAVVPHRNGVVAPTLLRACRAYDPDFVVIVPTTERELEQLAPGRFQADDWDELLPSASAREAGMEQGIDRGLRGKADERARVAVAEACSPYRRDWGDKVRQEKVTVLVPGTEELSLAHNLPEARRGAVLACPPDWGGLMGVALASRLGMAAPPAPDVDEPVVPVNPLYAISKRWFGEATVSWPRELARFPPSVAATGLDLRAVPYATSDSMTGLVTVYHQVAAGVRTSLSVFGDEPEDFALARLWALTFGWGIWLPSVFGVDKDEPPVVGRSRLSQMIDDLGDQQIATAFTSVSRDFSSIESLVDGLELRTGTSWREAWRSDQLRWQQPTRTHLAVVDQFEEHVPVPVIVDPTGARDMAAPPPPPVLREFQLPPIGELIWHVDVSWEHSRLVRGRGLDGNELCAPGNPPAHAWVRSGRTAISFQSKRVDFVLNGVSAINRLARPLLRDLSLDSWIYAMARTRDLVARRSEAGQRTALLERLLGDRVAFVDFFGGSLLPALRAMRPKSPLTREVYRDGGGVVLGAEEGVLNFNGFCMYLPGLNLDEVRDRLDAGLQAGVLRRGMVLRCPTCEQKQFQTIDKIGQTWQCTRCDENCDLDRRAWKHPADEPVWFYDLHPVGRHILRDNGEVASLLSKFLQAEHFPSGQRYQDVEGIELLEGGAPQVELDLVAYAADTLVVGECKTSDQLSQDKARAHSEIRKKCRAAQWLRADMLVFATTAAAWNDRTLNFIRSDVGSFDWGPVGAPDVRVVTGLGTGKPMINPIK